MSEMLTGVQTDISSKGKSELETVLNSESMQKLWNEKQEIRRKMNTAMQQAMEEAAVPFLEELKAIDTKYAFILKLSN
jgi:hypothetical protein